MIIENFLGIKMEFEVYEIDMYEFVVDLEL